MSLYPPPTIVKTEVFARMPDTLRRMQRSEWADANRGGAPVDCFLEGPSFDRAGNLYVVDIPYGRIFRISPKGDWTLVCEYDGWPNGLKIHRDGRLFVTDYKRGIVAIDPATGKVTPIIVTKWSESFKGVNDLHFAANGDLYFTDQGQTGQHDPTGRVYRLREPGTPQQKLEMIIGTVPSPNGLVLNKSENILFVAVTRANAVWRLPLMGDGSVSKAGIWIQLSGGHGGPDGLALDEEGGLICAHAGMGVWRFDHLGRPTHFMSEPGSFTTNAAFGGAGNLRGNKRLYITNSGTGTIEIAGMPYAGKTMFAEM
jgi:gluconolactonase